VEFFLFASLFIFLFPFHFFFFHFLLNHNPFYFFGILFVTLLSFRWYFLTRPGRFRPYAQMMGPRLLGVIYFLLSLSVIGAVSFESYFSMFRCHVSEKYILDNIRLVHRVSKLLDSHNTPYWLDYATLLNALRGESVNPWDHDTDISLLRPEDQSQIMALMNKLNAADSNIDASWDGTRDLIQVFPHGLKRGPHMDMWLWHVEERDGERKLVTADETVWYRYRDPNLIFPLKTVFWTGKNVTIPHDSHQISQLEFGHYPGSYMKAEVFRGDCFHNFFNLRFLY